MKKIIAIRATGTSGAVLGKYFYAKAGKNGFALHSEHQAKKTGLPTRFAANKVYAADLNEAARLIRLGGYHLRVWNQEHKQYNLRKASELEIVWGES